MRGKSEYVHRRVIVLFMFGNVREPPGALGAQWRECSVEVRWRGNAAGGSGAFKTS